MEVVGSPRFLANETQRTPAINERTVPGDKPRHDPCARRRKRGKHPFVIAQYFFKVNLHLPITGCIFPPTVHSVQTRLKNTQLPRPIMATARTAAETLAIYTSESTQAAAHRTRPLQYASPADCRPSRRRVLPVYILSRCH